MHVRRISPLCGVQISVSLSAANDEGAGRYDRFETAGSRSSAQARRLARVFQFLLPGEPFHGAAGRIGSGALWFGMLLGSDRLGVLARDFIGGPARHWGIEHFQSAAAGVDLVVMGKIREPLKNAKQLLVPGPSQDFYVARTALRTERPEPCQLVAAFRSRVHGEAAERAHQVLRFALAGLPRVLAEPDAHPFAVLRGGL